VKSVSKSLAFVLVATLIFTSIIPTTYAVEIAEQPYHADVYNDNINYNNAAPMSEPSEPIEPSPPNYTQNPFIHFSVVDDIAEYTTPDEYVDAETAFAHSYGQDTPTDSAMYAGIANVMKFANRDLAYLFSLALTLAYSTTDYYVDAATQFVYINDLIISTALQQHIEAAHALAYANEQLALFAAAAEAAPNHIVRMVFDANNVASAERAAAMAIGSLGLFDHAFTLPDKLVVKSLPFALTSTIAIAPSVPVPVTTRLDFIKNVFGHRISHIHVEEPAQFPDISDDDAHIVSIAVYQGLANGHADGMFRPDEILTVEQAVAMVIKYLDLRDHSLALPDNIPEGQFVAEWIRPYLKWAMVYSPELLQLFEIGIPASPDVIKVLEEIIVIHGQPMH